MNKSELIALYDQQERIDVEYPGLQREITPNVIRHLNISNNREGIITYSKLDNANADDAIREQVSYFKSIGQDFEWKLYDYDEPPDLKDRLASHGFTIEPAEALMILDLEDNADYLWQAVRHDVRRLVEPTHLIDVEQIEEAVWEEDSSWVKDYLGSALREYPHQMSVYAAYIDNQPASAAWIYFPQNSQFASLWGGATLLEYRQRGLYTALLAVRAQEARVRGVRYLTVDASPMSRPILEKHGFKLVAYTHPCKWKQKSNY